MEPLLWFLRQQRSYFVADAGSAVIDCETLGQVNRQSAGQGELVRVKWLCSQAPTNPLS